MPAAGSQRTISHQTYYGKRFALAFIKCLIVLPSPIETVKLEAWELYLLLYFKTVVKKKSECHHIKSSYLKYPSRLLAFNFQQTIFNH